MTENVNDISDVTSATSSAVSNKSSESSSVKSNKNPDYGSKTEIAIRVRESNGASGDKSLTEKVVDGIRRLWCKVCNVPLHAIKGHTTAHLKSTGHIKNSESQKVELNSTMLMSKALEK